MPLLSVLAAAPLAIGLLPSGGIAPYAPAVDGRCTPEVRDRIPLGDGEITSWTRVCTDTRTDGGTRRLDARTTVRLVAAEPAPPGALRSFAVVVRLYRREGSEQVRTCSWDERARAGGWRELTTTCRVSSVAAAGSYRAVGHARWTTAAGISGTTPADRPDDGEGDERPQAGGDRDTTGASTGAGTGGSTATGAATGPGAGTGGSTATGSGASTGGGTGGSTGGSTATGSGAGASSRAGTGAGVPAEATSGSTSAPASSSSSAAAPGPAPSTSLGDSLGASVGVPEPSADVPAAPGTAGAGSGPAGGAEAPAGPATSPTDASPLGTDPLAVGAGDDGFGNLGPWLGGAVVAALAAAGAHRVLRRRVLVAATSTRDRDEDPAPPA